MQIALLATYTRSLPSKPVQNQIPGLVAVAEVDGCKSAFSNERCQRRTVIAEVCRRARLLGSIDTELCGHKNENTEYDIFTTFIFISLLTVNLPTNHLSYKITLKTKENQYCL